MKELLKKGQISLLAAIMGSVGMIGASIITSWATTSNKVFGVENKINIVEEREQNHYLEIQKQLEKMDKKLDDLLTVRGLKK